MSSVKRIYYIQKYRNMVSESIEILKNAVMITGFVFMMMLFIEYLNVVTGGAWQKRLVANRWGQYVVAAFLGVIPGCLGLFAVVAMYSHRLITVGAVVAAMFATAGDESFVMFALFPQKALFLHILLFAGGALAGMLTDLLLGRRLTEKLACCEGFALHDHGVIERISLKDMARQWRECSAVRGVLTVFFVLFILGLFFGHVGHDEGKAVRTIMGVLSLSAVLIVATVPDHFLEEHLWGHVARRHVPRIFLWTSGALILVHLLTGGMDLASLISRNPWTVMVLSALTGLIPESGPHLIFVTLFAKGAVPFTVLLVNSIVQSGHGMLPLLAHSRRAFLGVGLINLIFGLVIGTGLMMLGRI